MCTFKYSSCRKMSFFTNLSCTFKDVKNTIQCRSNRYPHISKNVFIQACYQLSYIFERIGNAVLVPIKLDLQTGLKDLKSNYTSNNDSLLVRTVYIKYSYFFLAFYLFLKVSLFLINDKKALKMFGLMIWCTKIR